MLALQVPVNIDMTLFAVAAVIAVLLENAATFPDIGLPVVVTVPDPAGAEHNPSPRRNVLLEHPPVHRLITSLDAAVVNASDPLPLMTPDKNCAPVPPNGTPMVAPCHTPVDPSI